MDKTCAKLVTRGRRDRDEEAEGGIADYRPDVVVKETEEETWLIETKGREDPVDPLKWERLVQWCQDASAKVVNRNFRPLFVRQEQWEKYRPKHFKELCAGFAIPGNGVFNGSE